MHTHHPEQENARNSAALSRKDQRVLCEALIVHIDEATPWRSGEVRLSERLSAPLPASVLLLCGAAIFGVIATLLR